MRSTYPRILLFVGMISIVIAIILNRFVGEAPVSDFFQGMFTGMAVVLLPGSLFMMRKRRDRESV
jgi:hypothetical protein